MKTLLLKILGWAGPSSLLALLPGGSIIAGLWKGVRAIAHGIGALIGWFWEAVEITFTRPVVLTIVGAAVGLGIYFGIAWDARLVEQARIEAKVKVAIADARADEAERQQKLMADKLQETDEDDARKAEAAQRARVAAEKEALVGAQVVAGDASDGGAVGLLTPAVEAPAPARRYQVRRGCKEPFLFSLYGYCF
jgi:hypothetical protein